MDKVCIYGAYGYTGRLIVDEFISKGIKPTIAGRNEEKLTAYANKKGLEFQTLEVDQREKVLGWLKDADVLIHCGGPFIHTAEKMVEACIATDTHYLDITGEYQVFDLVQGFSDVAKDKRIMLMPGAGFDVVPSDCLASFLKSQIPNATDLQLAFVSKGGRLSRGTTKTMIENLGDPQVKRKNGEYSFQLMGASTKEVDYGEFKQLSVGISWGDISSAFFSTKIPSIEVFSGTSKEQVSKIRKMNKLSFLLKSKIVKNFLKAKIDKKPDGPSDERRVEARMYLWGRATDGTKAKEARLSTLDGYTLTAKASVLITQKILSGDFKIGYQTPSTAYGHDLILEIEGSEGFSIVQ